MKKKGFLQRLSLFLRALWFYFPGLLFVVLAFVVFVYASQGVDVMVAAAENWIQASCSVVAVTFWAIITWFSARLVTYAKFGEHPPGLLYKHFPRLLGFACFTVAEWSIIYLPVFEDKRKLFFAGILLAINAAVYVQALRYENKALPRVYKTLLALMAVLVALTPVFTCFSAGFSDNPLKTNLLWLLAVVFTIQLAFVFLVANRKSRQEDQQLLPAWITRSRLFQWLGLSFFFHTIFLCGNGADEPDAGIAETSAPASRFAIDIRLHNHEIPFFRLFNLVSLVLLLLYLAVLVSPDFARLVGSFSIAFWAFALLLGFGNIITLLSVQKGINFHFLLWAWAFVIGFAFDPYRVRTTESPAARNIFSDRPTLEKYTKNWLAQPGRMAEIRQSDSIYPVFFVLADGGASRSGYWTAAVLGKLQDQTKGAFSRHLFCLSGASGGSVGNTAFFSLLPQNRQEKDTSFKYEKTVREFFSNDFLSYTLATFLGSDVMRHLIPVSSFPDRAAALEMSMEQPGSGNAVARAFQTDFSEIIGTTEKYNLPLLFINTTRMQDAQPGVVSNIAINDRYSTFNTRLDVLSLLDSANNEDSRGLRTSTAAVLGARFPYLSPAGNIRDNYFVDGGYFDNSGAGVVQETIGFLERKLGTDTVYREIRKKMRFYVIHLVNEPLKNPSDTGGFAKVHPLTNDLAAPFKTIIGSYSRQTAINDIRLRRYIFHLYNSDSHWFDLNLFDERLTEGIPMNWQLSKYSLRKMNGQIDNLPDRPRFRELVETIR